jgi:sugar lactone lactonase YvrE
MRNNWRTIGSKCFLLGESLFWHPHEHCLYWIDIATNEAWRWFSESGHIESWLLPATPGCIAPARRGLVLALRDGIYYSSHFGGSLELIAILDYDTKTVRANDGKCDHFGRFWVATVDETKKNKAGGLYCIDGRGIKEGYQAKVFQLEGCIITGNGLAFDGNGQHLYFADTPTHRIQRWPLRASFLDMKILGSNFFAQMPEKSINTLNHINDYSGRPDGASCDSDGNYWVACYEGACIKCFSPNGVLLHQLKVPSRCPTIVCFGGKDLRTIFVASASTGRSTEEISIYPLSGSIFHNTTTVTGCPINYFKWESS